MVAPAPFHVPSSHVEPVAADSGTVDLECSIVVEISRGREAPGRQGSCPLRWGDTVLDGAWLFPFDRKQAGREAGPSDLGEDP